MYVHYFFSCSVESSLRNLLNVLLGHLYLVTENILCGLFLCAQIIHDAELYDFVS